MNGYEFQDHVINQGAHNVFSLNVPETCLDHAQHLDLPHALPGHASNGSTGPLSSSSSSDDSFDLIEANSDMLLHYIEKMLNEEDIDEKTYTHEGASALQAAEKSFGDALWNPPSPDQPPLYSDDVESPDDSGDGRCSNSNLANSGSRTIDYISISDFGEQLTSQVDPVYSDYSSQSLYTSLDSLNGLEETQFYTNRIPDLVFESQPVHQFDKGVEEATKFLPGSNKLFVDVNYNGFLLLQKPKEEVEFKAEERNDSSVNGSRGQKHSHQEDFDLEDERSKKQPAVYSETTISQKMYDDVLLCRCSQAIDSLREALENGINMNTDNGTGKRSTGAKSKGKKQTKRDVVDLQTLLIHCAQSVAADDYRSTSEMLKQIRQHSSPLGDGSQCLGHYFANGLEARLAGTGSQTIHSVMATRTMVAEILKAHQVYMAACPFKRYSFFYANHTILSVSQKATKLHIIEFGIGFGFQWPCFMQLLSKRAGGPPMLRITGIDDPQPGFRPSERILETGNRLKYYAKMLKIPFEYEAIASKLENIQLDDLHIDKDAVVVVNCLYQLKTLADETVLSHSPRDIVLKKIRKMNPHVFIHGIMNGSYSSPFFVTRFREAMFHFSAMFDMFDCTIPREYPERLLIEREVIGQETLNVIACEGTERVQRPENFKRWQVRNQQAGFRQLKLNLEILKKAKDKFQSKYNKEFIVDGDGKWLFQGWKGRIMYALSTWTPTDPSF